MNDSKKDKRVIKTKKNIRSAFIHLLNEKDYSRITIKDIATEASCDRKTVYSYYAGIHEIREEIENEFISLVAESIKQLDFNKHEDNPKQIFEVLTTIINGNIETYGPFLKWGAQSQIIKKTTRLFIDKVEQGFMKSKYAYLGEEQLHMIACFIASGMIATYQDWFNTGCKQSTEVLSSKLGDLVLNGINGFNH